MPKFNRGEIHIFTEDPYRYSEILPPTGIKLLITYAEVMDAITDDEKLIYTTQIYFLSHLWIKAGYDLILYDDGCTVKFDEDYIKLIQADIVPLPYYYMQDLLTWGQLYQKPE